MHIGDITGNFLVAVPSLDDPNFDHTVVLICEHTRQGAFGIVINKVLMNSINPLLQSLGMEKKRLNLPVYYGGPVNPDQGYVIYSPYDEKYQSIVIHENLAVTVSKNILYDIASGKGPDKFIFALGSAGWGANQLEEELMMGSWIVSPANYHIIFNMPVSERWRAAARLTGVDLDRYCDLGGTA